MIQYNSETGEFHAGGNIITLIAQTATIIHGIYNCLLDDDPEFAAEYKKRIIQLIDDNDLFTSEAEMAEKYDKVKQALQNVPEPFLKLFESLINETGDFDGSGKNDEDAEFRDHFFGEDS